MTAVAFKPALVLSNPSSDQHEHKFTTAFLPAH